MTQSPGLSVRQHKREEIRLTVQFVVAEEHRTQVRFSPLSNAPSHHTIIATATDVSRGGLGLQSRHYLPRMCEGTIRIYDVDESDASATRLMETAPVIEEPVKVRRVVLAGHEPTYVIGMAFLEPSDELGQKVNDLCERTLARSRGNGHA